MAHSCVDAVARTFGAAPGRRRLAELRLADFRFTDDPLRAGVRFCMRVRVGASLQGQPVAPWTRRVFSSTRLTVWADQSLNLPESLVRIRDDSNRFLSDIANVVLLVTEGDHGLPDFHRRRSSPIWKTKHEVD